MTNKSCNFSSVFDVQRPISCERVAGDASKIAILPRFWTSNVHFVRKGCVSWRSGGTAPALRENRRRARGDLQMWRCEDLDLQVWGCEDLDLQVWGCDDVDLPDVRVWRSRSAGVRMWRSRSAGVRVWRSRSAGVRMWRSRSAGVRVWRSRSADVRVWRSRSADVRVWRSRSAGVKVWRSRSAGVKVWRCRSADVKVWRCRSADVKVWRCSITAAFLRRTLRRRSREKIFQHLRGIPGIFIGGTPHSGAGGSGWCPGSAHCSGARGWSPECPL